MLQAKDLEFHFLQDIISYSSHIRVKLRLYETGKLYCASFLKNFHLLTFNPLIFQAILFHQETKQFPINFSNPFFVKISRLKVY